MFFDGGEESEDLPDGAPQFEIKSILNKRRKKKTLAKRIKKYLVILLCVALVVFSGAFIYKRFINPPEDYTYSPFSGAASMNNWMNDNVRDNRKPPEWFKKSYLYEENKYINGDKNLEEFYQNVRYTFNYEMPMVNRKTIYGGEIIKNGQVVKVKSDMMHDEEVKLYHLDWSELTIDAATIKPLMKSMGIKASDPDISMELRDLFLVRIADLAAQNALPVSSMKYVPELETYTTTDTDGKPIQGKRVSQKEDANIDNIMFGKEFLRALTKTSEVATGERASKEWYSYVSSDKDDPNPPTTMGNEKFISPDFIGAYRLQNRTHPVTPPVGDGTQASPLGLYTPVKTWVPCGKEFCPVRLEMTNIVTDKAAFDFFASKDPRNRGFTTLSQVKYAGFTFNVRNISTKKITFAPETILSDANRNYISATGTMFGMTDKLTLNSGQVGKIDTWTSSTNLKSLYLVWGRSLPRSKDVVWFKVLAASKGKVVDNSNESNFKTGGSPTPAPTVEEVPTDEETPR